MPKFRIGDLVVNPAFASTYRVTGVFAQKYTMTLVDYDSSEEKYVSKMTISTPIDLADLVLQLVAHQPVLYHRLWEEINANV